MDEHTITLKLLAQDLASGNVGKFLGGLDAMAKKGGLVGAMATGVGISFGQMLNPLGLVQKGFEVVTSVVGDSIAKFEEQQKLNAQTEAVLKSTGGAAGETAGQIEGLSEEIAKNTGIQDEAIQKGENLLLTFTNIKNSVGEGNDIFDRATRTITDMSVALGEDTSAAAIQLGKALNDPITGVTALRRVGVSFSQEQLTVIARLQQTGKTAEAQKIILDELQKEFGGSAEAFGSTLAGSEAKMHIALDDAEKKVGEALAGPLADFYKWIADSIPEAEKLVGQVNDLATSLGKITGDVKLPDQPKTGAGWDVNRFIFGDPDQNDARGGKFYGTVLDSIGDAIHGAANNAEHNFQGTGKQIGETISKSTTAGFVDGIGDGGSWDRPVVNAFSAMGQGAKAAWRERMIEMQTETLTETDNLADVIRGTDGVIKKAADTLAWAMEHPWKLAHERMKLEAELTSADLAVGLASSNPEIRAVAQQQEAILEAQWEKLTGQAWVAGNDIGSNLQGGISHGFGWSSISDATRAAMRRSYRQRHHARGGAIAAGDWGIVGEEGEEIVYNDGSGGMAVIPHAQTQQMLGGSVTVNVHFSTLTLPSPAEGQKVAQAIAPHLVAEFRRQRILG